MLQVFYQKTQVFLYYLVTTATLSPSFMYVYFGALNILKFKFSKHIQENYRHIIKTKVFLYMTAKYRSGMHRLIISNCSIIRLVFKTIHNISLTFNEYLFWIHPCYGMSITVKYIKKLYCLLGCKQLFSGS